MALPSVSAAGLNAVSPQALGKAAGVMNTMQQFGAVVGIAVATTVFNAHGSLASPAAITSGYRPALAVAAGLSVLGAAAALGLRRAPAPPRPAPAPAHRPRPAAHRRLAQPLHRHAASRSPPPRQPPPLPRPCPHA